MKFIGKCLLIEEKGKKILVVGDLHLGFEESMNESGVLIGRQMFKEMISDLEGGFEKAGKIDEVVLLGDVKHEFGGILRQEWKEVLGLFDYLKKKCDKIVVIRGNHDNYLKNIAGKRGIEVRDCYVYGKYGFLHGNKDYKGVWDKKVKCLVVGHIHPAVKLRDGVKVEKYKCFLEGKFKGKEMIVVPSFIEYHEGSDPRENKIKLAWKVDFRKFGVKVVGGKLGILNFGKLEKLS